MSRTQSDLRPLGEIASDRRVVGLCPVTGEPAFESAASACRERGWLETRIDCPACSHVHSPFALACVPAEQRSTVTNGGVSADELHSVLTAWWNERLRVGVKVDGGFETVAVGRTLAEEADRYGWNWEPYNPLLTPDAECPVCEREMSESDEFDAHHWEYGTPDGDDQRWTRVTWLCRECHDAVHDGKRAREQQAIAEEEGYDEWQDLAVANLLDLYSRYHQRPVDSTIAEIVKEVCNVERPVEEMQRLYADQYPACEDGHGVVTLVERTGTDDRDVVRCSECGYRRLDYAAIADVDVDRDRPDYRTPSERDIRQTWRDGESRVHEAIDIRDDARISDPDWRPPRHVERSPTVEMDRSNPDDAGYDLFE